MEGYHVISSKKVTLCDIKNEEDQKVNTLESCTPVPDEVIERACSPLIFEVEELLIDDHKDFKTNDHEEISCEDDSLGVLGNLTNNDSNATYDPEDIVTIDRDVHLSCKNDQSIVQQNSSNNYHVLETGEFDKSTSNELSIDQNNVIPNQDIENCSEYFTIDFIASPNESNSGNDSPDADESMQMSSETDESSENGDPPIIGRSGGKVPNQCSFEQYVFYICPQCGLDCGPIEKWKLHTETEHGFGLLEAANFQNISNKNGELCHKCRDCPKTFKLAKGFSTLILHRISHLPFKYYIGCRICSIKYRSKQTLKRHLQQKHKDLNVDTLPKFRDSALEHIRLFCPVCKEEQSNVSNWKAHMKEQHDYYNKARSKFEAEGNNIYTCNVCKMKVRENYLVEHIQTHEDLKPFHCTFCKDSTYQLRSALTHVRNKHFRTPKDLLWRCSLCKASFKTQRKRRIHYALQHKVVYQTCKVCKQTFNSSSRLLSHINLTNHHTS